MVQKHRKGNNKKMMEFHQDHPSGNKICLVEREKLAIPCINYLDFPDTQKFGGTSIDAADISHLQEDDPELDFMEEYATVTCVLFCPFFDLLDVKGHDGKHLTYFWQFIKNGNLKTEHE